MVDKAGAKDMRKMGRREGRKEAGKEKRSWWKGKRMLG